MSDQFHFNFTVTERRKGLKDQVVEVYQGVLPVGTDEELADFAREFRGLLLDFSPRPQLKLRKPPKGMVRVLKKAKGEEGE